MKKKPSPKRAKAKKSKVSDLPPRKIAKVKGGGIAGSRLGIRGPIGLTTL